MLVRFSGAALCGNTELKMRARLPTMALLCAGAVGLLGQDVPRPRAVVSPSLDVAAATDVPVLTVCEVLANASTYKGRPLIFVGKYGPWMEGAEREEICGSSPRSIWLGNEDSRTDPPPSEWPDYSRHKAGIIAEVG